MIEMIWRNKWLTAQATTIDEMVEAFKEAAGLFDSMKADGVTLDDDCSTQADCARLVVDDPRVARKYGLQRAEWSDC